VKGVKSGNIKESLTGKEMPRRYDYPLSKGKERD
jgi:hypothetical protein